jgi:hypothetical protein
MLCRACGNEMIAFEYCDDCTEAIHWKCSICYKENEKSVHNNCIKQKEESLKTISSVATTTAAATATISFISLCIS